MSIDVENLESASIDGEGIIGKVGESKVEEGKAKGFNMHVCCGKFQINGTFYYSSLILLRLRTCYKEKPPL